MAELLFNLGAVFNRRDVIFSELCKLFLTSNNYLVLPLYLSEDSCLIRTLSVVALCPVSERNFDAQQRQDKIRVALAQIKAIHGEAN